MLGNGVQSGPPPCPRLIYTSCWWIREIKPISLPDLFDIFRFQTHKLFISTGDETVRKSTTGCLVFSCVVTLWILLIGWWFVSSEGLSRNFLWFNFPSRFNSAARPMFGQPPPHCYSVWMQQGNQRGRLCCIEWEPQSSTYLFPTQDIKCLAGY